MWRLRSLYESVRNVVRWFPVIWRDRDWDYGFLLRIMQFKIRNMRRLHEQTQRYVGWERTVHEMRMAELLLERLLGEYEGANYKQEAYLTKQDLRVLFGLLQRKLRTWWD